MGSTRLSVFRPPTLVLTALALVLATAGARAQTAAPDSGGLAAGVGRGVRNFGSDLWHVVSSPARLNRSSALWVGATAAVSAGLYALDEDIDRGAQRSRGHAVYDGLVDVGEVLEPGGMVVRSAAVAGAGLLIGHAIGNPTMQDLCGELLESNLISSVVRNTTKFAAGRTRPEEDLGADNFDPGGGGNSFPSGHVSIWFEAATIVSHHADRWPVTVLAYGLASTVALQRIDDRKHWASDVFVPMVSGTMIARTVIRRHEARKLALQATAAPGGRVGLAASLRF